MKRQPAWWRYRDQLDWRVAPLVALVIVGGGHVFGYHRILLAQRDSIEHTYQVMSALETTLQLTTDAETGQRGYILTHSKTYLKPYSQAIRDVRAQPATLRRLVHDSPAQLARVEALELALNDKLAELARTLNVVDEEGTDAAREMVLSNIGREHMDRIRMLIAQMRQAEIGAADRAHRTRRTEPSAPCSSVTIGLAMVSIPGPPQAAFRARQ